MARYKYAVNLMLEFEGEKPPFKKDIKEWVEEAIEDAFAFGVRDSCKARVRSVDLD